MEWHDAVLGWTWWESWTADPQAAVSGGSHVSRQRISELEAKPHGPQKPPSPGGYP
jgi:hypothetical protein